MNPTLMKWLSIALGILAVLVGVYGKGRLDERELFNAFKREVAAAGKAQEAYADAIENAIGMISTLLMGDTELNSSAIAEYQKMLQYL